MMTKLSDLSIALISPLWRAKDLEDLDHIYVVLKNKKTFKIKDAHTEGGRERNNAGNGCTSGKVCHKPRTII